MGWSFAKGASKADVVREKVAGWEDDKHKTVCLRHSVVGNMLYAVMETTYKTGRKAVEGRPAESSRAATEPRPALPPGGTDRWIAVCILGKERNYGWGSKDMDESMGPTEASCPLYLLEMVPCPGGYATNWRERVREYHARKADRAALHRKIVPGAVLFLTNAKPRGPFVVQEKHGKGGGRGSRSIPAEHNGCTYWIGGKSLRGARVFQNMEAYDAAHAAAISRINATQDRRGIIVNVTEADVHNEMIRGGFAL